MIERKHSIFKGWSQMAMRPPPRISVLGAKALAEAKKKNDVRKGRSSLKPKKKTSVSA